MFCNLIYNILIIIDVGEQCRDDVATFHDVINIAKPFLLVHVDECILFSLYDAAHLVAVLDGGLGLLYTGFEFSEAVGYADSEVASVLGIGVVTPAEDVALRGAGVIMHVLVEGGIGH